MQILKSDLDVRVPHNDLSDGPLEAKGRGALEFIMCMLAYIDSVN